MLSMHFREQLQGSTCILIHLNSWTDFFCLKRLCDEATSALDSSTEGEILTSLRSLANNRTAIFIAHRLTTAMQCDEVYFYTHLKVGTDH